MKQNSRRSKMMSTMKRISKAATALLIFATVSTNGNQHQQDQMEYDDDVPLDVLESMDPKMIDFVVGGFPKCGTTYLQNIILYKSKRVFIPHHESHYLQNDEYEEFKGEFANVTNVDEESGKPLVSGYKSPFELGHHKSLRNLAALFPNVRMIITLRHPITQFESLYNYKLRKLPEMIPPVNEYVGYCQEQCPSSSTSESGTVGTMVAKKITQKCLKGVTFCTGHANYHQYLSRLSLTPMNTPEEWDLLDHHDMTIHPFPGWQKESTTTTSNSTSSGQKSYIRSPGWNNEPSRQEGSSDSSGNINGNGKLFLMEVKQFDNRVNQSMADDLNTDLETFLGLDYGDLPRAPPGKLDKKPKPEYNYPPGREEHVLDICLEKYKPLREVLLESSRKASKWIMEYLLHPSNRDMVIVSNMDIFERMLEEWKVDPCVEDDAMNE